MNNVALPPIDSCVSFPQIVPIKVIGWEAILDPYAISTIISNHLGEQDQADWKSNKKGAYVSYTFWVSLPDECAEEPLRKAIHALPGVVMQL
jgi:putative lipoic acid-binding regulatory protein